MVTINPAKQLQIDNRVGSIEVGKDADLVIWNHHPLSTTARSSSGPTSTASSTTTARRTLQRMPRSRRRRRTLATEGARGRHQRSQANGSQAPSQAATLHAGSASTSRLNANGPAWAITNARIVTVSGPVIPKGTIVIKGNRIEAVGANVTAPSGVKPVDAGGATVIPGLIDASTDLGPQRAGRAQLRRRERDPAVRPDAAHARGVSRPTATRFRWRVSRASRPCGVRPGGGTISGEIPVMNLDGWTWEEATLRPAAGLAITFRGAAGGRRRWWRRPRRSGPADRARSDEDAEPAARAGACLREAAGDPPGGLDLEPFVPVLDRRQALYVTAGTEQGIRDAVAWAEKQNVRIVLQTGADAQRVAGLLKQHDVPVILGEHPVVAAAARTSSTPTRIRPRACWPRRAFRSRSRAAGSSLARRPVPGGRAVGLGTESRDDAIKALTLDAARILGVDSQVGSIEPGKIANLVVMNGDPLEIRSQIQHVVIAGRDVSLDNSQAELLQGLGPRESMHGRVRGARRSNND